MTGALPASLTSFVGRDSVLTDIADLLATARLVTLYGPSGMGKTRLAEEAARRLRPAYGHGVALIDLTQLEQRDRLARFVAESLPRPLHDQSARPGREALLATLAELPEDERVLLVLDNCEDIVEDVAALCVDVLRAAPAVRILATSRIPLRVPGERWLRVPPLSMPSSEDDPDGEALQLLVERTREQMPDFAVTPTNRADLIRLCRTLDGIPLAIEMAAPWLRMVKAADLPQHLDLLGQAGSQVGRRESHRSLAAMVGATWKDCTPAQRAVWMRLWVLVGEWDLDAARAVGACEEVSAAGVLEVLEQLEFRSVVVADLTGGSPRFRMRETFRQEGRRAAEQAGLVDDVRRQHTQHFGYGVRETTQLYYTAGELDGMRWFGTHLPNIRAALTASCEVSGLAPIGLEMATGLGAYLAWWFHGSLNEGKTWLARTAALNEPGPGLAVALAQQGFFTTCQGDHAQARVLLTQAAEVPVADDDPQAPYVAAVLAGIEGAHRWLSGHADSVDMLLRAADRWEELGQRGPCYFVRNLAVFAGATYSADSAGMLRLANWLLTDTADAGYPAWNRSWALATAGLTELRHGDPPKAVELLRNGLQQQLAAGDKWGPGLVGLELAEALAVVGQQESAATVLHASLVLVERSGMRLAAMVPLAEGAARAARILGDQRADDVGADPEATLLAFVSLGDDNRGAPAVEAERGALSDREATVAELVAEGLTYREIAEKLFISTRTVESHSANIMSKLGLRNRAEVARWWHRRLASSP
ncbi:non-specific serine/threonine protein kinase [Kutzneria buriramensis]|uniref:Non-specific serine/threonine protein kinase n=1 Tax=Kutzneria buriramensis TaxID=1045776 RepID=A0A3E0GYN6_9PSEU|nr:non-specific serine/threonine protein kinase [Kutzneria buriramensis]